MDGVTGTLQYITLLPIEIVVTMLGYQPPYMGQEIRREPGFWIFITGLELSVLG
jgi:hypothetical protein